MTTAPDPKLTENPKGKSRALALAFVTLFIDLVGFSIIFPLFPAMLVYYQESGEGSGLFGLMSSGIAQFAALIGGEQHGTAVTILFGGLLGSLYSLLQFLCAPIFGALSDRIGRRPVVIFSLAGLLISYILWFFAARFEILVIARILGGVMSANISTVTAIVSDVTTRENRSKGMAVIGIAFGLGFILGPAIGGLSTFVDLPSLLPALVPYGLNPWSMAAAIAALITLANLIQAIVFLPETLAEAEPDAQRPARVLNPLALFKTDNYPGVSQTNFAYFLFLLAFSGMEFSTTFFAAEHFGFGPRENAGLFLFIGLVLTVMQGTYVQRFAKVFGPRRMSVHGLATIIPGLVIVGISGVLEALPLLFVGTFLLAAGASQATPCLTALASLYAPAEEQGRIMGVFRSLGALSRALGPLVACVLYWRLGSSSAYFIGAGLLLIPLFMAARLPEVPEESRTVSAG